MHCLELRRAPFQLNYSPKSILTVACWFSQICRENCEEKNAFLVKFVMKFSFFFFVLTPSRFGIHLNLSNYREESVNKCSNFSCKIYWMGSGSGAESKSKITSTKTDFRLFSLSFCDMVWGLKLFLKILTDFWSLSSQPREKLQRFTKKKC